MLPAATKVPEPFWPDRENAYGPFRLPLPKAMLTTVLPGLALLSVVVAVRLTSPPGGGVRGAVYRPVEAPVEVIVPQAPATVELQLSRQVTSASTPFTRAVKVRVAPASSGCTSLEAEIETNRN